MDRDLIKKTLFCAVIVILFFSGHMVPGSGLTESFHHPLPDDRSMPGPDEYWPSSLCKGCHDRIFEQHALSMHAKSFENPVFQAEYFNELLPDIGEPGLSKEAEACTACHSPVTYLMTDKKYLSSRKRIDPSMSGVTCDFCHTITGYRGDNPGNANYISDPGYRKLGPFKHKTDWHHIYSELQTKSEFCAICHNRTNVKGLEIISTFTEWKNSEYAERGIQCQDCHMNVRGFLTAGQPVYESGKAASITPGHAPYREKLYTHRFPGAHSRTQVKGALKLQIVIDRTSASPGDKLTVNVLVDNSRTGHKMPSGSAELRLLMLTLKAETKDKTIPVAAPSRDTSMLDVSGKGEFDDMVLGKDFPEKNRIYRAVCIDEQGNQTLFPYRAAGIIFDNRLNASEIRKESYKFRVPENAEEVVKFRAVLHYLPYPDPFAEKLGIPESEPVEIAEAEKNIQLRDR